MSRNETSCPITEQDFSQASKGWKLRYLLDSYKVIQKNHPYQPLYYYIMSISLSPYSRDELPKVLHSLKQYKKMLKEMGGRASTYFFATNDKNYRAEYDATMDIELALSYIIAAFDKHFGIKLQETDIKLTKNPTLVSGARIFSGDDMVDVTFKNIENTLKQL